MHSAELTMSYTIPKSWLGLVLFKNSISLRPLVESYVGFGW